MTFGDETNARVGTEQAGGVRRGRPKRRGGRNTGGDPQLKLVVHRRSVEDEQVAGIAAGDERHAGGVRALEILAGDLDDLPHGDRAAGIAARALLAHEGTRRREQGLGDGLLQERSVQQILLARRQLRLCLPDR